MKAELARQEHCCDCLVDSVADVEGQARGPIAQRLELAVLGLFEIAVRLRLARRVPNLSIGRYQLRLSEIAKDRDLPVERSGRWLVLQEAQTASALRRAATDPGLSRAHARKRVAEALEYGRSSNLPPLAAVAQLYAGELFGTLGEPYRSRLEHQFEKRRCACRERCCWRRGGPRLQLELGQSRHAAERAARHLGAPGYTPKLM